MIVGRPNAGKSSLFNGLAGAARAIVTDVPGTTRDLLTERVDIGGVPFTLVDTAGSARERRRRDRGRRHLARAAGAPTPRTCSSSCSIDRRPLADDDRALLADTSARPRLVVASKSDLPAAWDARAGRRAARSPR